MFTYIFIYFASFLFAYGYSKAVEKSVQRIFGALLFLVIFVPYGFRYGVGTDYVTYSYMVGHIGEKTLFSKFEIGWWPLLFIIRAFHINVQCFFIITAFCSVIIIFSVIPRKYMYICIPIYISISYLSSFTAIRQEMAASIFLIVYKKWIEKKYRLAYILGIISCCFHFSAIFLLILLPFTKLKWSVLSPGLCSAFLIFFMLFLKITNFGNLIMDYIVRFTRWSRYVDNSMYDIPTEIGTGFGFLLKEILCLCVLLFIKKDKTKEIDTFYNLMSIYTVFFGCILILGTQVHILNRLRVLFSSFYIYMILAISESKSKWTWYVVCFFEIAVFMLFIKTLLSSPSVFVGGRSGLGLVPYSSVFFK